MKNQLAAKSERSSMRTLFLRRPYLRLASLALLTLSSIAHAQIAVTLTAPANNSSSPVNTPISLAASVTGGTVARVKFKQNGSYITALGDTSSPYTETFTPTSTGTYVFIADAINAGNVVASSSSITVTVGNAPPTVSLTSPANGASQAAPATFTLTASASDTDGTIANVKFYDGATLLATVTASPFTYPLSTLTVGSHSLTAVATDNGGASTTSAAVSVSVTSGGGGSGPGSVTRTYVYDANQRLCKTIDPESGATVMDYDAAGNIAWVATGTPLTSATCDRASVAAQGLPVTTRSYDALNRLTGVQTPGGAADVTTTYTPEGRVASLVAANGAAGANAVVTTYGYNRRGLLVEEHSAQSPKYVYDLHYGYNANGHLSSMEYPDAQVVTYAPDGLGRVTEVRTGTRVYASNVSYYPNGAISGFSYGNGIVHTMTQDLRRLPTNSTDKRTVGTVTTKYLDDTYLFDDNGNVSKITDAAATGTDNRSRDPLTYDGLDRLVRADAPNQWGTATYTYDAIDNLRTAQQGTRQFTYAYDASNRLSGISGTSAFSFGYDPNGNVISKGTQGFTFDSANRMMSAELLSGGGVQSYRYDGTGRRVQATDPGTTTTPENLWVYSQSGQVVYNHDERRGQNLSYIYLGNTQIATRTVDYVNGGTAPVRYQHTDALGSPVVETSEPDASNVITVLKRNSYAPYGEAYGATSIDGTGYTGHVMDRDTGLTYMQQRYYDPQVGRFTSVDPVPTSTKYGSNLNRYSYGNNNPIKFTDPDGRFGLIGAGIGMAIDLGMQLATSEGSFSERVSQVDLTSVAVAGAVGAVTGGFAGVLGKAAVAGSISVKTAVAGTAVVSGIANAGGKAATGGSGKEVAVAGLIGLASGAVGAKIGNAVTANVERQAAKSNIWGTIGQTTQAAAKEGGKVAETSTTVVQKATQTVADAAAAYAEKRVNQ